MVVLSFIQTRRPRSVLYFRLKLCLHGGLSRPCDLWLSLCSPTEHRCVESAKIRNKYPDRVPVSSGGGGGTHRHSEWQTVNRWGLSHTVSRWSLKAGSSIEMLILLWFSSCRTSVPWLCWRLSDVSISMWRRDLPVNPHDLLPPRDFNLNEPKQKDLCVFPSK